MQTLLAEANILQIEPELFQTFIDEGSHYICVRDEQGRHLYANKAMQELYPPDVREGIIGETMYEGFDSTAICILKEENRRALALGRTEIIQDIIDYTGKPRVFLSKRIGATSTTGRPLVLGISTDITELAMRERALAKANEQLSSFAALAAHDLRSPLATFVGLIDLIGFEEENRLTDESRRYLELMRRSAVQLADNVGGLLTAFKADHSGTVDRREADLNILFEQVRFNLGQAIEGAGAKLFSNRLPTLPVDGTLVRHLLQNLIENALKYRRPGVETLIILRHERTADGDLFSLEDNGRGISAAEAARVFNPYDQGDKAGSGVGLGLSLCQKVIELHGGKIWIDTEFDRGCRVCFTLA